MILGMSTSTFTLLHVLISLVGIGTGLVVMYGLLTSSRLDRWTATFIATTAATSLTGFAFPNSHITPGIVVGILSLVALAAAIVARYGMHLSGAWRSTYVISASVALYFNVFVLVVQSFEKAPALKAIAPTQKEPPFVIAQLVVMALFVGLTVVAVKRFHVPSTSAGKAAPERERKAA
jgi:hypothetical protein